MTDPAEFHIVFAQQLLQACEDGSAPLELQERMLAKAQVHATLAVAKTQLEMLDPLRLVAL